MQSNPELLKKLKKIGWAKKTEWEQLNPNQKKLSPHKILNSITEPKDWNEIAAKCSNNPKHELYGHTIEEILAIWKNRSNQGKDRGNTLDDYITAKLIDAYFNIDIFDDTTRIKCLHFDRLYEKVLSRLSTHIGNEIWLNSVKLGITCRLDSAFTFEKDGQECIFVAEWKNTENITVKNTFQNFLGPAGLLHETDLNKYTLQTHIYRYILEEYNLEMPIHTRIFQFRSTDYQILKDGFDYDPKFIEEIVKYSKRTIS